MARFLTALSFLLLLVIVGAVVAGGYAAWRIIESTVAAIPPVAFLVAGGGLLFAFVFLVVGGAVAIVQRMARANRRIYADRSTGLYPVIDHGRGVFSHLNEPGAQSLAALASAAGRRPTAALAGRVIDAHYSNGNPQPQPFDVAALPEPAALTARDVVAVDPREHPHWLLVGSTGSGKTIASYAVLGELARRAPCQFVITEPGGVNWGAQTTATTTPQIARAILEVAGEMERRQALLRAQDVDHVQDLAEPLPYLVLVAEETETVLDDLRLTDRATRDATIIALRSIARMGRKCGVCLVAVTQSGTTDVFDSHVRRNLSNVLLFRSQHTTGETWRVSRDVQLAQLPTGAAWSVRHSAVVAFPLVARPALPQVQPAHGWPELAEPVLADVAIPVENWPTAQRFPAVLDGSGGSRTVLDGSQPVLAANEEPPAELAAQMRQWHAGGVSKNEICRRTWPAKNGVTWEILDRVLAGEL